MYRQSYVLFYKAPLKKLSFTDYYLTLTGINMQFIGFCAHPKVYFCTNITRPIMGLVFLSYYYLQSSFNRLAR